MHLHKTRWSRILCSWLIAIRKYQIPPFLYHAYFVISFVFIPAKRLTYTRTQSGHYVTPCFSSRRHTIMHVPAAWLLNLSFRFFGNFFYFSFCCSTQLAIEKIIISIYFGDKLRRVAYRRTKNQEKCVSRTGSRCWGKLWNASFVLFLF